MFALRCLHPPGGAVALTAVVGGPAVTAAAYHFVLFPVLVNSTVLMLAALAFNNATRRAYPHVAQPAPGNRHQTADRKPSERLGVRAEDLDAVLSRYDQVLDISRDDLGNLVQQAEIHAYRRRFGEITCAAIMSRDVIAVQFDTPLAEAWRLLRRHDVRALPVVDPARRVIGMVSDLDFIRNPDLEPHPGLATRFRRILRTAGRRSTPSDVVGEIMPHTIRTVGETMHVAELVPLMADAGLRHVPVVDGEGGLSGIIAQSDLIAALYRGSLGAEAPSAASKAA
jgi:CBS domain-containing membrane protein